MHSTQIDRPTRGTMSNMFSSVITRKALQNYSLYELRMLLISKEITVGNSRKGDLLSLAEAAISVGLTDNVNYHDDVLDFTDRLFINGCKIPDQFQVPENEFTQKLFDLPPFRIKDIFNFLIFKSTQYDRKKIASYKIF